MSEVHATSFVGHLATQLGLLHRSAALFDQGHIDEALHLATTIRVLVRDSGQQKSVLTHLGIKNEVRFEDTAVPPAERALVSTPGLTIMRSVTGKGIVYEAPLGDLSASRRRPALGFEDWWNVPVIRDMEGHTFSRRDLVLAVADKEGGAHVDAHLDPAYAALSRANSMGFVWRRPDGDQPLSSPVPASIRQIAFEVSLTLDPWLRRLGRSDGQ